MKNARMRQEFSANVSHELKTPLTSISGYAELIETGMASEQDTVRFAHGIHNSANRLLTLINDIIRLSELDGTEGEADTELLESGILTAWLPAFETATGYIAEVYAGDASVLAAAAAAGEADVLLMKRTDASALGTMTHYPLRYELVSTIYSVI